VFEEVPGWQHVGDAAWQGLILRDLEAMIVRDRNHPSLILWGARVNESADYHDFYTATNALAHRLDPTRQTGGVRYKYDSERLEDVFTMNDFGYDLRPPNYSKYFVTEFCGHLYPTKSFDQEERVRQHAIHHAHVHNQIGGQKIAGGIGWCAFDYNTSLDFGSGDRICYHGVMDIFRQPKIAAGFYAAHADPATKIVLEPATYWKMGDKAGGGVEPLVIFSNCDEIEIFVGSKSRGRWKPDREKYSNLARPPFVATGLSAGWGMDWEPLELRGYIGGKHVITRKISHDGQPARLEMTADDPKIVADAADMTRVGLRIVDEFGNVLPFAMQPVTLKVSGPGELVGDNPFPMPGGRGAVYVRSTRKTGVITVLAETARLKPQKVTIRSVAE
jgi:beta-galactosidase